ncbi:beta-lactamase/transpeptidase-like protein [Lophiotrema nucula]|uniref:Beta-lactamase/transpeptidase-like protein n=1 Tax=Lophiotrema nucula TaxID=690887 RepID=A0A6A5Z6K7_9PLEO|nr:beta-lactamase/transpeptidase-like protein [Lophiotrema nucula]
MADFEQILQKAVEDQEIPGCVLHAINRDGSFKYAKCFGKRSVREGGDQSPLQFNTTMWIASCTKLMTSISAMQLVEQGKLSLDEPVYKIIPELKEFPILKGFDDDGKPIEEPHTVPITLRLLLSHSSGLTYGAMHPLIQKWLEYKGLDVNGNLSPYLLERFNVPMVFEPGSAWMYGPSIDFAGLMVERASGLTLEQYMQKNLWKPLGIKDMTFFLSTRPDLKERLADMSERDPETGKVVKTDGMQPYEAKDRTEVKDCMGGQGVFSSAEEYIKVLHAILTTDENEKILKKSTVEEFFKPQLTKEASDALNASLKDEQMNNAAAGTPQDIKKDWGLGGLLILGETPDGKQPNTMFWGGYPNLIWWCDRKAGLTGLYAGQVVPPGDAKCAELDRKFEAGIYELYRKSGKMSSQL